MEKKKGKRRVRNREGCLGRICLGRPFKGGDSLIYWVRGRAWIITSQERIIVAVNALVELTYVSTILNSKFLQQSHEVTNTLSIFIKEETDKDAQLKCGRDCKFGQSDFLVHASYFSAPELRTELWGGNKTKVDEKQQGESVQSTVRKGESCGRWGWRAC